MINDPCQQVRAELEETRNKLKDYQFNGAGWDTSDEVYQRELAELQENVLEKEKALRACEASHPQRNFN